MLGQYVDIELNSDDLDRTNHSKCYNYSMAIDVCVCVYVYMYIYIYKIYF
jgi:hypothetical protein